MFIAAIGLSILYTIAGLGMRNVDFGGNAAKKEVDEEEADEA